MSQGSMSFVQNCVYCEDGVLLYLERNTLFLSSYV